MTKVHWPISEEETEKFERNSSIFSVSLLMLANQQQVDTYTSSGFNQFNKRDFQPHRLSKCFISNE